GWRHHRDAQLRKWKLLWQSEARSRSTPRRGEIALRGRECFAAPESALIRPDNRERHSRRSKERGEQTKIYLSLRPSLFPYPLRDRLFGKGPAGLQAFWKFPQLSQPLPFTVNSRGAIYLIVV